MADQKPAMTAPTMTAPVGGAPSKLSLVRRIQADINKLPAEYHKLLVLERGWDQKHPVMVHTGFAAAGLFIGFCMKWMGFPF